MCGTYFNEKALPPIKNYDIHVYFDPTLDKGTYYYTQSRARQLVNDIYRLFPEAVLSAPQEVGIVGPHLKPNYEIDIKPEAFGKVVAWLMQNNPHWGGKDGLTILIHPKTGDEWRDHVKSALWLGKQIPLNDDFFKNLAANTNRKPANKKFSR